MNIKMLVKITSRAWSLDILALMHAGVAGRQAPLLSASGASRTAFKASLIHLIEMGLLEKNPGHGHPLRPEYRLTADGKEAAKMASSIMNLASNTVEREMLRRSWTIPILGVTGTPLYFNEIKHALSPVTDRSLSQSLSKLYNYNWLQRDVDIDKRPLRATYQASHIGARISIAVRNKSVWDALQG